MSAYNIFEAISSVVDIAEFSIKAKSLTLFPALSDEQIDLALAPIASRIGMITHVNGKTVIELA